MPGLMKRCSFSYFPFQGKRAQSNSLIEDICQGIRNDRWSYILRILLEILSTLVALLLVRPQRRWYSLLTVINSNWVNSDLAFWIKSRKLWLVVSILPAKSGPIFEKNSLKPSAISLKLVSLYSPILSSFTTAVLFFVAPIGYLLTSKLL